MVSDQVRQAAGGYPAEDSSLIAVAECCAGVEVGVMILHLRTRPGNAPTN
jgi:hypothetical protein